MTVKKDDIIEALRGVIDPELGIDVVSLGMINEVFCINNSVHLIFSPTSKHCPIAVNIGLAMKRRIQSIDKVKKVEVTIKNFVDEENVNKILNEE